MQTGVKTPLLAGYRPPIVAGAAAGAGFDVSGTRDTNVSMRGSDTASKKRFDSFQKLEDVESRSRLALLEKQNHQRQVKNLIVTLKNSGKKAMTAAEIDRTMYLTLRLISNKDHLKDAISQLLTYAESLKDKFIVTKDPSKGNKSFRILRVCLQYSFHLFEEEGKNPLIDRVGHILKNCGTKTRSLAFEHALFLDRGNLSIPSEASHTINHNNIVRYINLLKKKEDESSKILRTLILDIFIQRLEVKDLDSLIKVKFLDNAEAASSINKFIKKHVFEILHSSIEDTGNLTTGLTIGLVQMCKHGRDLTMQTELKRAYNVVSEIKTALQPCFERAGEVLGDDVSMLVPLTDYRILLNDLIDSDLVYTFMAKGLNLQIYEGERDYNVAESLLESFIDSLDKNYFTIGTFGPYLANFISDTGLNGFSEKSEGIIAKIKELPVKK